MTDAIPTSGAPTSNWRLRPLVGATRLAFPWNLLWDQRHVVVTLVRSQIARRHRRSVLGWAWNLIQPGSQALLLFVATRGALRVPEAESELGGFGVFFAAYIIAQGMGEIVTRGPTLITERAAWVKGSLFPLELLAPTAVGVSLYRVIPGGLLGIACVVLGDGAVRGLEVAAAFAIGLALAIVWGVTLGLALSALGVYLRDAVLAAPIITLGMIFVSPLYIDPNGGDILAYVLKLNPLSVSMNLVLSGLDWIPDHLPYLVVGIMGALLALWLAATLFRRLSANFADYV